MWVANSAWSASMALATDISSSVLFGGQARSICLILGRSCSVSVGKIVSLSPSGNSLRYNWIFRRIKISALSFGVCRLPNNFACIWALRAGVSNLPFSLRLNSSHVKANSRYGVHHRLASSWSCCSALRTHHEIGSWSSWNTISMPRRNLSGSSASLPKNSGQGVRYAGSGTNRGGLICGWR